MHTAQLCIGQKVYSGLYGGMIYRIDGEQDPESIKTIGGGCIDMGGRASFGIVFENGTKSSVPESIVRGVQWKICDHIYTREEIDAALKHADDCEKNRQEVRQLENISLEQERERIKEEYAYLTRADQSKMSSYALGAYNIRAELKRAYPGIKFSVRSKGYTGGSSIDIGWTDGPTVSQVEAITGKYQEGHFDGMTDCYNYNRSSVWPDIFGGAKYVFEERNYSKELVEDIARKYGGGDWEILWDNGYWECRGGRDYSAHIRHDLQETSRT